MALVPPVVMSRNDSAESVVGYQGPSRKERLRAALAVWRGQPVLANWKIEDANYVRFDVSHGSEVLIGNVFGRVVAGRASGGFETSKGDEEC